MSFCIDWPLRHAARMVCAGVALAMTLTPVGAALGVGLAYVDADNGENFSPNLSPPSAIAATPVSNDNLWGLRSDGGAASPGTPFQSVFEASGGPTAENAPQISQLISSLAPNTNYNVYVAYWQGAEAASNWGVRAGFASGNLTLFNAQGPNATFPAAVAGMPAYRFDWDHTQVPTNPDDVSPLMVEAGRELLLGFVGSATSNTAGEIGVFIDDLPTTGGPDADPSHARTWFDGLAYVPAGSDVLIAPGDFNNDDLIDPADAHIFLVNLHTDISQFTVLQAYRVGDLNVDLAVTHADFAAFKRIYTSENGTGADGELSLRVLTDGPNAGEVQLQNGSGLPVAFDYYEVRSASGALNPAGWTSIDDLEGDDQETIGWDEVPASDSLLLSELNLQSSMNLSPSSLFDLGQAFQPGGARDLEFFYGLTDGSLVQGAVQYLAETLAGDYNGDGSVGNSDLTLLLNNWGDPVPPIPTGWTGAQPTPNAIGNDELTGLLNTWGLTSGSGSELASVAVPEADCIRLIVIGCLALIGCARLWRSRLNDSRQYNSWQYRPRCRSASTTFG